MSTYSEKIGNELNLLLTRTYDAEKGYQNAAEDTKSERLKAFFKQKAAERYTIGHELKREIESFGQDIDKGGSTLGSIHRAWMDLKSKIASNNEEAVLEEVITGEKKAIGDYQALIENNDLPSTTKLLLQTQMKKIKEGLAVIKKLEEVY